MNTRHNSKRYWPKTASGFTIVEVLIALALSVGLLAALWGSYIQYRRMMKTQEIQMELQSNVRVALHTLARNVSMSGYGLDIPNSQLPDWVTWGDGLDSNPKITQGTDGAADTISVAGAFRRPTQLAQATSDSTTLVVESGDGSKFNTDNKKLIYVGGLELARITGISGDTLTVSTHPSLSAGLHNSYPAGTSIDLVEVRKFSIDPEGGPRGEPCLMRRSYSGSSGDYINAIDEILHANIAALGIEDLQVGRNDANVDIQVTGVATEKDRTYDEHSDHLRRLTVDQRVIFIRNLCQIYEL